MRVLNLYAGLGGNRKKWEGVEVTAIEKNEKVADIYSRSFPNDTVLVMDAKKYLLDNYQLFDFIWSSPPCQSHSFMRRHNTKVQPVYPDLSLYQEIILLSEYFTGKWVVENVRPYYNPLYNPLVRGRHLFWANFYIPEFSEPVKRFTLENGSIEDLSAWLGIEYENPVSVSGKGHNEQALRNCVHPDLGLHIFRAAFSGSQKLF